MTTVRCIADAFRQDCTTLIERFENLETVRFEGFVKIWKDMKFSFVFSGRSFVTELYEFCEDALMIARDFFLPPHSFKARMGGLYLLYGLYFKMPIKGPKIRMKLRDWQDVIEIREEINQAEHHDASYILSKLIASEAFIHCPVDSEKGLEKSYRQREMNQRNIYSVLSDLRDLAGPEELLHRLHEQSLRYSQCKASLPVAVKSEEVAGDLRQYDSDLGKKLLDDVAWLEGSRKSVIFEKSSSSKPNKENSPQSNVKKKKVHLIADVVRNKRGYDMGSDWLESDESCDPPTQGDLTVFTSESSSECD